jgi:hypothetical protein
MISTVEVIAPFFIHLGRISESNFLHERIGAVVTYTLSGQTPTAPAPSVHPVRDDSPLLCPGRHAVQGSAAGMNGRKKEGRSLMLNFESICSICRTMKDSNSIPLRIIACKLRLTQFRLRSRGIC